MWTPPSSVIPLLGFLPAEDPRMLGTIAAVEADLLRPTVPPALRTLEAVENSWTGFRP